jgi:hypothetical protein
MLYFSRVIAIDLNIETINCKKKAFLLVHPIGRIFLP